MLGTALAGSLAAAARDPWRLTVQTTGSSQTYTFTITSGSGISILIDWGDGTVDLYTSTGQKTHTYTNAGTYKVKVSGRFSSGGNFNLGYNAGDASRLKAVSAMPYFPGLIAFNNLLKNCSGLTGSIPADLFRYNPGVTTNAYIGTFYGCTGLTGSIPADLCRYNPGATSFDGTFYNCSGLSGDIPVHLLRYNIASLSFANTFYGCPNLRQNSEIFYADGEQATRFLNKSVNFTNCFRVASYTGAQGVAPDLWNCTFGTGTPTTTDCWQGHSAATVSNFASIPVAWV